MFRLNNFFMKCSCIAAARSSKISCHQKQIRPLWVTQSILSQKKTFVHTFRKMPLPTNEINSMWTRSLHLAKILCANNFKTPMQQRNTDMAYYLTAFVIFMIGVTYACVPLYKMYCQVAGIGGDPTIGHRTEMVESMKPVRDRPLQVTFTADRHSYMSWNFKPAQSEIEVVPGETALAFYTAENPTDEPIIGIATYNVIPLAAGNYFNKIQCFCFEQQWLDPHEKVELPVFFYIDPEFDNDPELAGVDQVVLSYTFFKAEKGFVLPLPGFMRTGNKDNTFTV